MLGVMYGTYSYIDPNFFLRLNKEGVLLPHCKANGHVTDNQTLSTSD